MNELDVDRAILTSATYASGVVNAFIRNKWSTQKEKEDLKTYKKLFLNFFLKDRPDQPNQDYLETALKVELDRVCSYLDLTRDIGENTQVKLEREVLEKCKQVIKIENILKNADATLEELVSTQIDSSPSVAKPKKSSAS